MAEDKPSKIVIPSSVNFISKGKGHTNSSRNGGNTKGLKYLHGEIPVTVWEMGIQLSGNKDYWRENDYRKAKEWLAKNPYWKN